jgi:hypothetical protein
MTDDAVLVLPRLRLYWKCACTPREQTCEVLARDDGEDIIHWMEYVQAFVGREHHLVSPACRQTTLEYLKIPTEPNGSIGAPRPH